MVNKTMLKLFGYKKGELEGKNVSMLMPPPFSTRHNSFLRNYITTGKAKIIDSIREVRDLCPAAACLVALWWRGSGRGGAGAWRLPFSSLCSASDPVCFSSASSHRPCVHSNKKRLRAACLPARKPFSTPHPTPPPSPETFHAR